MREPKTNGQKNSAAPLGTVQVIFEPAMMMLNTEV
jgi:hypothetical protein